MGLPGSLLAAPHRVVEAVLTMASMTLSEVVANAIRPYYNELHPEAHIEDVATDALDAVPNGWAKWNGEWVQVAQADRYDVEGPSGVIDGANVLVTLPKPKE